VGGFGNRIRGGARVNNVSLIGALVEDPELGVDQAGRDVCVMKVAVPRRGLGGDLQPGVIYVDVVTFGKLARTCADRLSARLRVGVSGILARDDSLEGGPRRSRWEVHAYQVDLVDAANAEKAAEPESALYEEE
jgi:single-stranded DNA-binding protein